MNIYRIWQIKRGERVTGPFPEKLIVEHVLLGRIKADDLITMDGHAWKPYRETPEIIEHISRMMGHDSELSSDDPVWYKERLRAVLRYVDERKHLDPRSREALDAVRVNLRSGDDRRQIPETVEQRSYRETIAAVDQWLLSHRPGSSITVAVLLCIVFGVGWALHQFGSSDLPVDIGLHAAACDAEPIRRVDWHGCDKSDYFLVGADLREANLTGVRLTNANLAYANLDGAHMESAILDGANLTGAVWVDGRVCADRSFDRCR